MYIILKAYTFFVSDVTIETQFFAQVCAENVWHCATVFINGIEYEREREREREWKRERNGELEEQLRVFNDREAVMLQGRLCLENNIEMIQQKGQRTDKSSKLLMLSRHHMNIYINAYPYN